MTLDMAEPSGRTHPVDCGWAWVVLLGCTCNFALIVGTIKSFGIFFIEFLVMFDASVSMTSMIAGLMQVSYSFFSLPIMAIGLRYLTPQQTTLCGGLLAALAYALGCLAQNVNFLLFTHGLIFGIAFGCIHGPSAYVIGQYFEKRRSLANACVTAGGSLGGLVLPSIFEFLVETYGLRGALLLTSALLSHSLIGGMLMRPAISHNQSIIKQDVRTEIGNTKDVSIEKEKIDLIENKLGHLSAVQVLSKSNPQVRVNTPIFEQRNGRNYPRTKPNIQQDGVSCQPEALQHSLTLLNGDAEMNSIDSCNGKSADINIIGGDDFEKNESTAHFKDFSKYSNGTEIHLLNSEIDEALKREPITKHDKRFSSHADLFTASITDLSQMQATADLNARRPNADTESTNSHRQTCLTIIHIDFSLLKNPVMSIFLFVYCLGSIGSAYGHIYIAALARDLDLHTSQITALVSAMSGCDIVGRFLCGAIVDRGWMTSSRVIAVSVLITGAMMQLAYFFQQFWSMLIYSIVHGLFAGGIFAMTPTILIDFLGFQNFRSAMGIAIFSQGFALAASAPLIGFLRDRTHTYISSFQFMGGCMLLAGIVLLLKPVILRLLCRQRTAE
ncbi:monocarboxylate transporter 5-like [Argopecten irradians]|uniref:monocarboxylate transporter 5-like n=1 Tax=Argopecten irradians TaxID=31199 RepID=UPI00371173C4